MPPCCSSPRKPGSGSRLSSAASTVGIRSRALCFAPRRSDWSRATIGRDLSAGLMVVLVALPLALGFGVASDVGAAAGITTAIVAGILAAR